MKEIPKSGEVWCEGARLAMSNHPCNKWFDLNKAITYLEFAIQFTPQYGDSFLEIIRAAEMLKEKDPSQKGRLETILKKIQQNCLHAEPNYGVLWFFFKNSMLDNAIDIWENAEFDIKHELARTSASGDVNWLGS